MPKPDLDVLIIGAGVAGLAALRELSNTDFRTLCVEGRDRIGGRVLTITDPLFPLPIELGPEFIHGRPHETWDLVREARLAVFDSSEDAVHIRSGHLKEQSDAWEQVDEITEQMKQVADSGRDPSFLEFIQSATQSQFAKQVATSYVEGFNAADKEKISVASLAQDARAAEEISGDKNFRFTHGYSAVPKALVSPISQLDSRLQLNSIVTEIHWEEGSAEVSIQSALTGEQTQLRARRVVVTAPLGVLRTSVSDSAAIRFDPVPVQIMDALDSLEFGQVMRLVLRFRSAWWEQDEKFADAGFWLSQEKYFPTWWTTLPMRTPLLTGWSAGPHADRLLGKPRAKIIQHAIEDLARISGVDSRELIGQLEEAYFHDWSQDPFARGAYSYVRAGGFAKRGALEKPVENMLFFAGEATELSGHGATVHGAIATGKRAAKQVLESLTR